MIGSQTFSVNAITSVTIGGVETRFNDVWEEIGLPIALIPVE